MIKNSVVFMLLCAGSLGAMEKEPVLCATSKRDPQACCCSKIAESLPRSPEALRYLEYLRRRGCAYSQEPVEAEMPENDNGLGDFGIITPDKDQE